MKNLFIIVLVVFVAQIGFGQNITKVSLTNDSINNLSAKLMGVWSHKINLIDTIYIKFLPNGKYYFDFSEKVDSTSMSGKWRIKEHNIIEFYDINIHRIGDVIKIIETEEEKNRVLKSKIEQINKETLTFINLETNERSIYIKIK